MGGNLFECSRLDNSEFKRISKEITHKLFCIGVISAIPDGIKNKHSHGDVDFICAYPVVSDEQLKIAFGPDLKIHRNTDTISIFYESKYQVDLNFHPGADFNSAFNYNRGSDCGNLIGVLYSRLRYSYGHKGLQYRVNLSKEDSLGAVSVSKDQKKILEFVGLDYDKWSDGFESVEDLFLWVVKSKYFNKEFYQFENLNHQNRIRNKKRPVFKGFVEWLEGRDMENNFVVGDKSDYIWKGLLHFGDSWWIDQARPLIEDRRRKLAVREIFSGVDLLEMGYAGKELGAILNKFKSSYEDFDSFVLSKNKAEMIEIFKKFIDKS